MSRESKHVRGCIQVVSLVSWLLAGVVGALAQNPNAGSDIQGTIFAPALERVSQGRSSVLLTTLILQADYSTNLLLSQVGPRVSGEWVLPEGKLQYSLQRHSNNLLLTYDHGERFYPHHSNLNTALQDARLQWESRVTKRLNFTFTQRYARLPIGAIEETNPGQGFPLIGAIPEGALFLQQRLVTFETSLLFDEKLTQHTTAVLGGDFVDTTRRATGLIGYREGNAYGGIYFQVSPRQTLGVIYSQELLKFTLGFGRSQVENLFLSYTGQLTPKFSVSLFGGSSQVQQAAILVANSSNLPGFSSGALSIPQRTSRGVVGGAKIDVHIGHNTLGANYTRLVTNGAGFLATVLQQKAEAHASRAVTKRLDLSIGASYSKNDQIGASQFGFKTYYLEPAIRYNLTPHLRLTLRDAAGKSLGFVGAGTINRDEAVVQLEYTFREIPIGK